MKIHSLEEVFIEGLTYAYDAEKQLTEALPKMAKASTTPQLREAFEAHLQETQGHVRRIEQVFKAFGKKPEMKPNTVVQAMTKEADQMMKKVEASPVRDAALIVAANQVEHFEMAVYISLKSMAETLGNQDAVQLLDQTLSEEEKAAHKVTEVGKANVNQQAAHFAAAGASH